MGASLNFSKNRDQVSIIFENGKESIYFDTKEEALDALIDCRLKNKITEDELNEFAKEVIYSNLISVITEILKHFFISLGIQIIQKDKKLENLYPELCNCGNKSAAPHAYIYNENGGKAIRSPFFTKMEGYSFCEELLDDKVITEEEYIHLKTEISLLKIPESNQDN